MRKIFGVICFVLVGLAIYNHIQRANRGEVDKPTGNRAYDSGRKVGTILGPIVVGALGLWLFFSDGSAGSTPRSRPAPQPRFEPSSSSGSAPAAGRIMEPRLPVDWGKYIARHPWGVAWPTLAILLALFGGFWVFTIVTLGICGWLLYRYRQQARRKFWSGHVLPGVVISANPDLVAVFADLAVNPPTPRPAIKIVKQPLQKLAGPPPAIGNRVAAVAIWDRKNWDYAWWDFHPEVVNAFIDQEAEIERVFSLIPEHGWQQLEHYASQLDSLRPGLHRLWPSPRSGLFLHYRTWQWRFAGALGLLFLLLAATMNMSRPSMPGSSPGMWGKFKDLISGRSGGIPMPTPPGMPNWPQAPQIPTSLPPGAVVHTNWRSTNRVVATSLSSNAANIAQAPAMHPVFAGPMELNGRVVSFTTLQGKTYSNIELIRADTRNLLYRVPGGGGGAIPLASVPSDVLLSVGVMTNAPGPAKARGSFEPGDKVDVNWGGWKAATITRVEPPHIFVRFDDPASPIRHEMACQSNWVRLRQ